MAEKAPGHVTDIREQISSEVRLYFMRHGQKERTKEKPDRDVELTPEGKRQAIDKGTGGDMSQAVTFGSPRVRTQETSGFAMAGKSEGITGTENLEELKSKTDKGIGYGTKISVDERLDFTLDEQTPYGAELLTAFVGGTYLKFLVEQSDQRARELGDTSNDTYSRMAARIASLVEKYEAVAPRWDRLVQEDSAYAQAMERYMATHQGVAESFLLKIVEAMKGKESRDALVSALGNMGFDFTEGFEVDIRSLGGTTEVVVSFKKEKDGVTAFEFHEKVPEEIIRQIASSG